MVEKKEGQGFYKIRDRETGLYSRGGITPSWNKRGKVWRTLAHVKLHLRQSDEAYHDADLVAFEQVERSSVPICDLAKQVDEAQRAERERHRRAEQRRIESEERRQLARLKEKYGA